MTSSTATPYCRAADDRHASALTSPRLIDRWWSLYQNAQNLDRACGHLRQRHCLSRTDSAGRSVMGGIRPLLTLAVVTFRGGGVVINAGASGRLSGYLVGCRCPATV